MFAGLAHLTLLTAPGSLLAIGFTLALALVAWSLRAVTLGGAVAGLALTSVFCLSTGPQGLVPVFCLFLLTFLSTRMGNTRKQRKGLAERKGGRRAGQIFANVGVGVLCVLPLLFVEGAPESLLLIGMSAALAEAAADTVSSEIGQWIGGTPMFILSLQECEPGTDGGLTPAGTFAGFLAACALAASCVWAGLLTAHWMPLVILAATLGMLFDSLLGATLERDGRLGNDGVNYSSSAFAAMLALSVALLFSLR